LAVGDRISRSANLRAAVGLLDDRAESRPESLLRVLLLSGGLPQPQVNFPIHAQGVAFRADLAYPERRLAIEYQGDYHRDQGQWRADMSRRARLEELGWRVLEVNADDLRRPDELCRRVRILLGRP
jgi:very-short-patch-repair endonuclease